MYGNTITNRASSAESLDDSHMCPMQHIEAIMLGSVGPHLDDIKVNQFSKASSIIYLFIYLHNQHNFSKQGLSTIN